MKKILKLISILMILSLMGCSTVKDETPKDVKSENNNLKNIKDGEYYILHSDNTIDPLYLGDPSFEDIATAPSDSRTIWFKEDWDQVPTMYLGDSLVFYSTKELDEQFTYERFEDYGYTVGVRNLKETQSKRYSVGTKADDKNTYPEGDTDELLLLSNENVIIDKFAGVDLRAPEEPNPIEDIEIKEEAPVTRSGTIKGLNKDGIYEAEVWDGTKKYVYKWKADVRALGSMEVYQTNDYEFTSDILIKATIPEEFKTGYYMINGAGLFRYVKDSTHYDENTDFNERNITDEDENDRNAEKINKEEADLTGTQYDTRSTNTSSVYNDEQKSTFTLNKTGQVYVKVYVNAAEEEMHGLDALIETPGGQTLKMTKDGTEFSLVFITEETGTYIVKVYGLKGKEISIDAGFLEEEGD